MKLRWKSLFIAFIAAFSVMAFAACDGGTGGEHTGDETQSEYGTVTIDDVKVYIDENRNYTFAEINPVFSKPDKAEELTYEVTKDIKIENNIVIPLKLTDKSVGVRAKSEHFNTTFHVEIEKVVYTGTDASTRYVLKDNNNNDFPVDARKTTCTAVNENTTLFIGDSFMDDYFIGNFMSTFATGKEVINAGMSSTTSYHWEAAFNDIIGATAPKNIVMHIGTNNFYDKPHDLVQDTEESLTRLMMLMHSKYPTTKIYWFNITQRLNTDYADRVTETNAYMAAWCEKYDWITCVDTCSKIDESLIRPKPDGTHPTDAGYEVFMQELVRAGCEIVAKSVE